jgi:mRNA interferase HicA
MRGNEFIRKIQKYAKAAGLACEWRADRGKGSHGVLIVGTRRTVVRNPKDELKTGTYHAMLKQLGLTERDIR